MSKYKRGTPIYKEENMECEYCAPRVKHESDGFSVCTNPLSAYDLGIVDMWMIRCPIDFKNCHYYDDLIKEDLEMVKKYFENNEADGWLAIEEDIWDDLMGDLKTEVNDRNKFLTCILSYWCELKESKIPPELDGEYFKLFEPAKVVMV